MSLQRMKKGVLFGLKWVFALAFAYVLSFIGKELIQYGSFSFIFIFISVTTAFFYLVRKQKLPGMLIIGAVLVAIALFLRFYVILAYGS